MTPHAAPTGLLGPRPSRSSAPRGWLGVVFSCVLLVGCTPSSPTTSSVRPRTAAPSVPGPRSPGDARYVSVHGDDDGPGTASRPWRTLAASLSRLYAGQVLYVHGGVYREVLTKLNLHRGRPGRPIVVTNAPGETPVIKGAVSLHRPVHWFINGLDVTSDNHLANVPRFLVRIVGGIGWHWSHSEIWGSRGSANMYVGGFGRSEPRVWSVTGSCLHGLRAASSASNLMLGDMDRPGRGIVKRDVFDADDGQTNLSIGSAHGAPGRVKIRFNTLYGGRFAITVRGGPRDVRIERNLIQEATSDVLMRFDLKQAPGTVVSQNYAVVNGSGRPQRLMRPAAESKIGGPGNVESVEDPHFPDPHSCSGFRSNLPEVAPYGRYGQ